MRREEGEEVGAVAEEEKELNNLREKERKQNQQENPREVCLLISFSIDGFTQKLGKFGHGTELTSITYRIE